MPRKKKNLDIQETPIIFFLKLYQEETINPIAESFNYSDILETTEIQENPRFSKDILKTILDSIKCIEYSENIACFWCCHSFKTPKFHLPITYDTYKNIYVCKGNFCSPECSLAYLYSDYTISDSTRWNRHVLLSTLYKELYEECITPSPPKELLRLFGGPLDIKQYRSYIYSSSNDIINFDYPPVKLLYPTMAIQSPLKDIKKNIGLSSETLYNATESLRLKRSKPVNLNIPTLDLCIPKQ